ARTRAKLAPRLPAIVIIRRADTYARITRGGETLVALLTRFEQVSIDAGVALLGKDASRDQPVAAVVARSNEHQHARLGHVAHHSQHDLSDRAPGSLHHLCVADARCVGRLLNSLHLLDADNLDHTCLLVSVPV